METAIIKGDINQIDDCEDALVNLELGIRYFSEGKSSESIRRRIS